MKQIISAPTFERIYFNTRKKIIFMFLLLFIIEPGVSKAQQSTNPVFLFEENKNQYPSQVKYKVGVGDGTTLFMEKNKFTFVKFDPTQLEQIHENSHKNQRKKEGIVNFHAFEMNFIGTNPNAEINSTNKSPYYKNYFKGNNPSNWVSEVYSYQDVNYKNIYSGIDIHAYNQDQFFKYDFIVAPNTDPGLIKMQVKGTDELTIEDNKLIIKTSVGNLIENIPYTYQVINGVKIEVKCNYVLTGQVISFGFPEGYNNAFPLIIDPILIAATYSGAPSSTTTYGHCATYDDIGNIYTGGECFDPGYPTTSGAFQSTFSGSVDIAISKLNPNGSALIWASYIGGSSDDVPNSLFVNTNQEIYILGATGSANYPTSIGCFDNSYNGSEDIVVTHLNSTGTALVGSTYVGGSNDDGGKWVPWSMNGHDGMRGEIIVDAANNAWIASFTSSANFPISAGTYDNSLSGTWDACAFRLSGNMSTLQWSFYLGGTSNDGSYGLRLNSSGELYVTGFTESANYPSTAGVHDNSFNGSSDAYVSRFNAAGNVILSSTFIGTTQSEIGYFLDIDVDENIYIYGSSAGAMPVTVGVYNNVGSGNFISKFNPGLTSLMFSTVVGDGSGSYLEPEAFMVDKCKNIYISGFGSTDSYPITSNALYPTQVSANYGTCYFMVLSQDAASLLFGSFYFGWHVDGGTSRFDPNGLIYQGICVGSGEATTPPWAYKDNSNPPSWDMYVVKIDFEEQGVVAHAGANPSTIGCAPFNVNFTNTSNNAVSYYWDFNDAGSTSTVFQPSHTFNNPGSYNVMLVVNDPASCNIADTTYLTIIVGSGSTVLANFIEQQSSDCNTIIADFQNTSQNANTYLWDFGDGNTSTQNNPSHAYSNPGNYLITLTAFDTVCDHQDQIQIQITVDGALVINIPDGEICEGQQALLDAGTGFDTYLWSTGDITQTITVNQPGTYTIQVTKGSCTETETVILTALSFDPSPDTSVVCPNNLTFHAGMGSQYLWSTGDTTENITVSDTTTIWYNKMVGYCLVSDTIVIRFSARSPGLFIPNSFTPNGDEINEIYYVVGADDEEFELMIFDRWGEMIFYSDKSLNGWDGKYQNGKIVPQGTYVWKLLYKTYCLDAPQTMFGHVNVIR